MGAPDGGANASVTVALMRFARRNSLRPFFVACSVTRFVPAAVNVTRAVARTEARAALPVALWPRTVAVSVPASRAWWSAWGAGVRRRTFGDLLRRSAPNRFRVAWSRAAIWSAVGGVGGAGGGAAAVHATVTARCVSVSESNALLSLASANAVTVSVPACAPVRLNCVVPVGPITPVPEEGFAPVTVYRTGAPTRGRPCASEVAVIVTV